MKIEETLRQPIAESWRRSTMLGLDPANALDNVDYGDIDRAGPLLAAASPVLDDLNERLAGTRFCTLLIDRDGRVAHRWGGDSGSLRVFDDLGFDVGASLMEEAIGTNAPGVALETRKSVSVTGDEHFAVALRRFSCYGQPIFHPATRRIEGVLDLSALADDASPLLPPLISRAVADIEQRLLDGSRVSDKHLLTAFQAAGDRRRAIVALGHDMFLTNQAAMDLLGSADMTLLRVIASDIRDGTTVDLTLESGVGVQVKASRVQGARGGILLRVEPMPTPRRIAVPHTKTTLAPVLISGPPGSGRTTRARRIFGTQPTTVLTSATALLEGSAAWARDFNAVVRASQGVVCVDGIDLLPDDLLDLVIGHAAERRSPQLVVVSGPTDALSGRVAVLAGMCTEQVVLQPLSGRLSDIPELVSEMMRDMSAPSSLYMTPGALRALSSQSWPGNLRELRAVLEYVLAHRSAGPVTVDDLPEAYRSQEPARRMAPIERAERDTIIAALRANNGNKVRTAEELGISRTTLYAKMRALRITVY